ncbi:MAG: alpha/beta hydrolase [Burkholderiaceae bacterium]|nr:alpha/beta hydrolase [Burkholderiaceae bacterium]
MFVAVNATPAYAYTGGRTFDPARPVVVFVHGAEHDHSVWILQSRYLAHHGWAVLAPDLPGHGRRAGPAAGAIAAIAAWLLARLAAAGVARATLVGHSMGSLAVLEAAARAPARVERLVMVATAFPMKVSDALLAAARDDEARALDMINYWSHSTINARPGCPAPGFSIFVQNRRLMERQRPGVLHTDFATCNTYAGGLERADALACPVLFVLGRRDAMTPPRQAQALIEHCRAAAARGGLPAPSVVELPDCGHAIMQERPDALLAALRGFLPTPATLTLGAVRNQSL